MSRKGKHAFTILETLMAIAFIGLLAGIMVANTSAFMGGLGPPELSELLRKAVRESRFHAAAAKEPVYLSFNEETLDFEVHGKNGLLLATIDTERDPESEELSVKFRRLLPGEGDSLRSALRAESEPIEGPTFHPDRSSTQFIAEIETFGDLTTHRYDPFSDSELTEFAEQN